ALVVVDGRPRGFTPAVLAGVPVGKRTVRVTLAGRAPYETVVDVQANREAQLTTVVLEPTREVTAVSRYAQALDDAPSSVSVLDGRELRAFGYPTIAEALRGTRGVSLSNDRAYQSIGIRGLGQPNDYGDRLLVLSDGQPLNDNLLNSSYVGSDGRVDLGDVDRIEVVRGPGSLLYGAGALSGVVNLVTRPRAEPTSVELGFGTYDNAVIKSRAGFNYDAGNDRGVWGSVTAAHSDGVEVDVPLKATGKIEPAHGADAFNSVGTAGRAYWGPFTVQWFVHTRDQSIPVGAYATTVDDPTTAFTDTRMMTELRYERALPHGFEVLARAHANRYTFHGLYDYTTSQNVEDYYGTWLGLELRGVYKPSPTARITLGMELQGDPQATLVGESNEGGATTPYLDEHDPYGFGAVYAVTELSPTRWLRVEGGARLDVYSTFGPIFVPRAAVILKPTSTTTVKVMGGRAFRAPSIYEQVYNDGGISEVRAVDPARGLTLAPESVYSGEIEASQRFATDWIALVAAHASDILNVIDTVPDTPGSALVRYANSPHPTVEIGGDVEIRREWRRGWMLAAMYGYERAETLDSAAGNPPLVNAPQHLASFKGVVPVITEVASFGLRATLEAPRVISVEDGAKTGAGVVVDATVSGAVPGFGLRYVVGVYDIGDYRYSYPVSDTFQSRTMPQNGRTVLLDLLAKFP
ncbi:MAG TPA: TonB-dependent receptor, partial [Byssovorax sp.]